MEAEILSETSLTTHQSTWSRRRRNVLDDPKERKDTHLKDKALDRTKWKVRFGRGFGPVVIQTTK